MIVQLYLRNLSGTVMIWDDTELIRTKGIGRTKYRLHALKEHALTNHTKYYSTILRSNGGLNKWLKLNAR